MKEKENCNPEVWKKILRIGIAILSAILGALVEGKTEILSTFLNI